MAGMTANGEPLNSRTITVWLPERDRDYMVEIAEELGLYGLDGKTPNRNGALRAIIDEHRRLRAKRLARKR